MQTLGHKQQTPHQPKDFHYKYTIRHYEYSSAKYHYEGTDKAVVNRQLLPKNRCPHPADSTLALKYTERGKATHRK